ncbi:unnamed protein product [Mycena citricolor]|uniref:Uncharacterized protein n=1 Tax=Mycena citricolor TaxID=2018698 RepID=A0AAD2HQP5_9AGAR|nr:unnamed protein product [Mycena citricolor]
MDLAVRLLPIHRTSLVPPGQPPAMIGLRSILTLSVVVLFGMMAMARPVSTASKRALKQYNPRDAPTRVQRGHTQPSGYYGRRDEAAARPHPSKCFTPLEAISWVLTVLSSRSYK